MPRKSITQRLRDGERLLMDGGTGSEIQRRGVDVLAGATSETGLQAWSATANLTAPDVVQQVHQDYLRVGADVIISNNFWTTPARLKLIGLNDRWEEYARAAGENAVRARDAMNPEAYVAGGVAPPTGFRRAGVAGATTYRGGADAVRPDIETKGRDEFISEFADHARLLARVGVDVMLPEYINHVDDAVASVEACAEAELPVWLGVRLITQDGRTEDGKTIEELVRALKGKPVDAVLLMCCGPEAISAALPRLKATFDGPVGAYPNVGYAPMAPLGPTGLHVFPGEGQTADFLNAAWYPPSRLAEFAGQWLEMGAQIVGGCCAAGPEHVMAMRDVVKGA